MIDDFLIRSDCVLLVVVLLMFLKDRHDVIFLLLTLPISRNDRHSDHHHHHYQQTPNLHFPASKLKPPRYSIKKPSSPETNPYVTLNKQKRHEPK